MFARNTDYSFGTVTRLLHWLTALVIFIAFPLGFVANRLPHDTAEALAWKAQVFSLHKTLGVAAFGLGVARLLWATVERRPGPLHPERRAEHLLAQTVHWLLYISLVAVPLSGWVHHAAVTGFAPILWPFGQGLPFVQESAVVAAVAGSLHWVFTKLLALAILLHVAGALKHHFVDRDATLVRMLRGLSAPVGVPVTARKRGAFAVAAVVCAAGVATAALLVPSTQIAKPAAVLPGVGNWTVESGTLALRVRQMGASVSGTFAGFTADIRFDEVPVDGRHGDVRVVIDVASLTLGSVTKQALEADFLDAAAHPTALFVADIIAAPTGYVAEGTLTLHGVNRPVRLLFSLDLQGERAVMAGTTTLDRRDFAIGQAYDDEASVGFAVEVTVDLVARRGP